MATDLVNNSMVEGSRLPNHDIAVPYYHLALERDLPHEPFPVELPEGYSFVFYRPGDKASWIDIELSSKEVSDPAAGEKAWGRYFEPHESEIKERMVFLMAPNGQKVGTATAYYDNFSADDGVLGWLHWVGLKQEVQGKHLSKPLIGFTLNRLMEMGYSRCHISTQTITALAVKVYMDFGFAPTEKSLREEHEGWEIIWNLTHHPMLANIFTDN